MLPLVAALIGGRGLKLGGIALAAIAIGGVGFKKGLDWRADQVERARAEAAQQGARADQAESNYGQLRRRVEAATLAGQQRALEQEKRHAQDAKRAKELADRRITGVLDHTRRMLDAVAPRAGPVRPRPLPEGCPARNLDDPAVERALIGRSGACAQAEERLRALQQFERDRTAAP